MGSRGVLQAPFCDKSNSMIISKRGLLFLLKSVHIDLKIKILVQNREINSVDIHFFRFFLNKKEILFFDTIEN